MLTVFSWPSAIKGPKEAVVTASTPTASWMKFLRARLPLQPDTCRMLRSGFKAEAGKQIRRTS